MLPEAIAQVRTDAGEEELSLVGYCMGGLFCLVYAGWSHDPKIRNIVTIASPIDAHQAGIAGRLFEVMNRPLRLAARYVPLRLDDIDPKHLRVPGWLASTAFKLTNPMGTVRGYIDLLLNLWDREYITEYQTMSTWFNDMHDYPGGIIQDFVLRVGLDNQIAKGQVKLGGGDQALLDRIDCSLLAIAGQADKIVTLEAAKKVMDIVASTDKDFIVAPGGHAGVFAGSKAPGTTWLFAADWLSTRSD
jgi:polyhydroxyalkanoate synthase